MGDAHSHGSVTVLSAGTAGAPGQQEAIFPIMITSLGILYLGISSPNPYT